MKTNFNLKKYNTFNIDCFCDRFLEIYKKEDLLNFLKTNPKNILFLGNGSNLLFTKNFKGTVVYSNIKEIQEIKKTKTNIYLKISSGYN
jgi:UDP-N-acetylmuramate dehydrogenase